jgi:hypothetical protein
MLVCCVSIKSGVHFTVLSRRRPLAEPRGSGEDEGELESEEAYDSENGSNCSVSYVTRAHRLRAQRGRWESATGSDGKGW